jgi:hypothetical protein
MKAGGVLPFFAGIAVHDAWKPYDTFDNVAGRALCGAHVLRELVAVTETGTDLDKAWARQAIDALLALDEAAGAARAAGKAAMAPEILAENEVWYRKPAATGIALNAGRHGRRRVLRDPFLPRHRRPPRHRRTRRPHPRFPRPALDPRNRITVPGIKAPARPSQNPGQPIQLPAFNCRPFNQDGPAGLDRVPRPVGVGKSHVAQALTHLAGGRPDDRTWDLTWLLGLQQDAHPRRHDRQPDGPEPVPRSSSSCPAAIRCRAAAFSASSSALS